MSKICKTRAARSGTKDDFFFICFILLSYFYFLCTKNVIVLCKERFVFEDVMPGYVPELSNHKNNQLYLIGYNINNNCFNMTNI